MGRRLGCTAGIPLSTEASRRWELVVLVVGATGGVTVEVPSQPADSLLCTCGKAGVGLVLHPSQDSTGVAVSGVTYEPGDVSDALPSPGETEMVAP